MANTILAKMAVQIAANTAEFNKALQKSQNDLKSFTGGITKLAGTLGVAFGVQQVASFAFEVSKLAGEAEGVKAAFDRLPESQKLMTQLKDATAGTVSELELMKRTVQASNFGIALESLPELLKFASIRAQQTGQSVDYLVDSIITGIGRKSPLILDNLGISAVRLKEKFNGASLEAQNIGDVAKAVGAIASEELTKMGDFSDNASSKVARLSATWENFKVAVGQSQFTSGLTDLTTDFLELSTVLLGGELSVEKLREQLDFLLEGLNSNTLSVEAYDAAFKQAGITAGKLGINLIKLKDDVTGLTQVLVDPRTKIKIVDPQDSAVQITTLETLQAKLKDLNDQFTETDAADKKKLANVGQEILKTQELIAELEKYRKKEKEIADFKGKNIATNTGLLATADAYNKIAAEAQRAAEEVGKFITAFNPVSELPTKITDIGDSLRGSVAAAKEQLNAFGEEIQETALEIGGMVSSGIAGIAEALGESLAGGGFENFGKGLLEAVASFAQQLGGLMIAMGIGEIALRGAPGPAKIAAGVALVAAGAAVKKLLAKQKSAFPAAGTSGGSGSTGSTYTSRNTNVSSNAQDTKIAVESFAIRGQDIWVTMKAYESNNKYTRTANG